MEKKINKIVEIIGDYRIEDFSRFYKSKIDSEHFNKWLNQFDEPDREFLVDELLHMLPKSYLTKENTVQIISTEFDIISKDLGYDDINRFLDETKFLDCQQIGKSQKVFLSLVEDVLHEKYNRSLASCGTSTVRNWFYTDDVLASGGTFREEILLEIENYGLDEFIKSEINIIGSFVILHDWATRNVKYAIDQKLETNLSDKMRFYRVVQIQNNPIINWYNQNPKFNHVYPIENFEGNEVLNFIDENLSSEHDFRNEKYAFRNPNFPQQEDYFSSPTNRIRYENILLNKGFEIMQRIATITSNNLRPLGMTNPSNKTLGTGTHFFTWRNISNTCPLVFWWDTNGWSPLFVRKH